MGRRIFYMCYDHNRPAGGEKHSYQHVDVLNANGFEAYALHRRGGMRLTWFENSTRVVDGPTFKSTYKPDRDILVFPEDFGGAMLRYPGQRVIFNKNLFHGFRSLTLDRSPDPYLDDKTVAVLAVSDHNFTQLQYTYPSLPCHRVYAHIRQDLFTPVALRSKQRQIAAVPKAIPMVSAVFNMFKARAEQRLNNGLAWNWVWLKDKTERDVAEVLQHSPVLVFLSIEEGLPRIVLEAMACGCVVVAFNAGPLLEILPPEYGIAYGELQSTLHLIETVVDSYPETLDRYSRSITLGLDAAARFSSEMQTRSVCAAWHNILRQL
jgi:hypothetical protein